jgi:hypothetical protein
MLLANFNEEAFHTGEGTSFEPHPLSDLEEGPRLSAETGADRGLNGGDFGGVDGGGDFADAYEVEHARDREERHPLFRIKAAEDVAGEERKFYGFEPIRPAAAALIQRQELFETLAVCHRRDEFFGSRLDVEGEPAPGGIQGGFFEAFR